MKKTILLALMLQTASVTANAHPGHGLGSGFAAGLLHPLTGWDHLLVMFALGIWAARRPNAQGWQLPLLFVGVMALSACLTMAWLPEFVVETLVAASVMVMGLLLVYQLKVNRIVQLAVVALAAVAHGYLHGLELGSQWSSLAGMVLATAFLHGCGWWLGRQVHPRLQYATQLLGAVMLGLGTLSLLA